MNFEVNNTYFTRLITDADQTVEVTIASRTAKTITDTNGNRFRVFKNYEGNEAFRPWGNYSMCPTITADKKVSA